jgi:hypothetical protein
VACLISPGAVQAAVPSSVPAQSAVGWRELRTKNFSIIYPDAFESLAQALYGLYGQILDSEYERFASFFNASLTLPISIRIYPTVNDYVKLNSLAPKIGPKDTHSHIGDREISVIGSNVTADLAQWQIAGLDAFRFELAVLFTGQATNQKAPPGLLAGVGGYSQDPAKLVQNAPAGLANSALTWRSIFESESSLNDPALQIQATSVVAYLVDEYGWDTFMKFLLALPTAQGYREAAADVFGQPLNTLQDNWLAYFPFYLRERWKANAFYNFDFATANKLLDGGAYAAADKDLTADLAFLQRTRQSDKVQEAQALLDRARKGQEAELLLYQANQALQAHDYARSLELVSQARQAYAGLKDSRRTPDLDAYQKWAEAVLGLREQVAQIRDAGGDFLDPAVSSHLDSLYSQLARYGDTEGMEMVRQILRTGSAAWKTQALWVIPVAGAACLLILALRLLLAARKPSPEARL